jgi:hypothetical protein
VGSRDVVHSYIGSSIYLLQVVAKVQNVILVIQVTIRYVHKGFILRLDSSEIYKENLDQIIRFNISVRYP